MKKSLDKFNQGKFLLSNKNMQVIKGGGDPEDEPETDTSKGGKK